MTAGLRAELNTREPTLRRIAALLKPYRRQMLLVGVAVLISAAITAILPFLTRAAFDQGLFPADGSGPELRLLAFLVAGMIALPIVSSLISIGQNYLTARIGNSAMADLRSDLFAHLQTMELGFFTATKTGAIQSRLANDVSGVRTVLTDTATTILQNTVTVISALVAMIVLSWQLTILAVILMPLFVWIQIGVGQRRRRLARKTQESLSEMTAITEEALSVSGILLARAFGRGPDEVNRYRRANHEQTRLQVRQAMTGRAFFAVVGAFFAITPALIYLAAGLMLDQGIALTAGTLVAFTTLQAQLRMPLLQLMRVSLDVQTSLALFRRIFEYLDLEPAITDRPGAVTLDPSTVRGDVQFDHVWFAYPPPRRLSGDRMGTAAATVPEPQQPDSDEIQAPTVAPDTWTLRDINLRVEPGQFAAIVGPSGAGKTSAGYLVPRFYDVSSGTVRIDGHDIRDLALASISDIVGVVTQEPYLFHGSVRDNIAYARPDAPMDAIEHAAREANIHEAIMSFAEGYDTIAGERGYRLSGGEKQRLAIARVLLKNPPVLVLDEATSALDSRTERLVQQALERAARGRTTIAIAHRLSTIAAADVIFGLADGHIVESGTHASLIDADGLYARLYREQFTAEYAQSTQQ